MADSASPRDGFTGLRPDAGKANTPTTSENAPCRRLRRRGWGVAWMLHSEAGWRVGKPSFVRYRREPPASRTARFGTTCRSKPGR